MTRRDDPLEKAPGLVRGLGAWATAAIVVGTMIGTGIFLKPAEMAQAAGASGVVFAAWIVGGILSMFGALSYAELGAAMPEAGGEYAYLSRGFSPIWGYLFGWMHSIVGRPASAASIAAGLLRFLGFLFPVVATPIFTLSFASPFGARHTSHFVFTWAQPLAAVALIVMTFVNYLGVRLGGRVQVVLTFLKIAAVFLVIGLGFLLAKGAAGNFHPVWPVHFSWGTMTGFGAALAAALWAYDGWEDLNLVGSEIENPETNIPFALIAGVAFVAVVFVLFSGVCFYALPVSAVAASQHVASDVFESFAGHGAALWITLAMVISALGTLNSSVLSGARVDYAMARDGLFFESVGRLSARTGAPVTAIVVQGVLATAIALVGRYEQILNYEVSVDFISFALTAAGLFALRRKSGPASAYSTPGHPYTTAIFVLACAGVVASTVWHDPANTVIGLGILLTGIPVYLYWSRRTAAR